MAGIRKKNISKKIGFISTRIAGTDGVSLEIAKWADVFERNGHQCFYFAGEIDRPRNKSMLVEKAHFKHPAIEKINKTCFGKYSRSRRISNSIHSLREYFKGKIYKFVRKFGIDVIVAENVLSIPSNIPFGLALTEFIAETGFPTIAHHHDFYWERKRFLINGINDYLQWAFPSDLPSIKHVVINSLASEQLSDRKGISNIVIPNVYDFANPPVFSNDNKCAELRKIVGLHREELFILQPTRIIPRKQIERSIEIVSQIQGKNKTLVISHSVDDEGNAYCKKVKKYAKNLGVKLSLIKDVVGPERVSGRKGKKFSIGEVYRCADLVVYLSEYEGFGNAFLEAVYYKKPIVVNRYPVYVADIEPKGFEVIAVNGLKDKDVVRRINNILSDSKKRDKTAEKNYNTALKYFSYETLEKSLNYLMTVIRN